MSAILEDTHRQLRAAKHAREHSDSLAARLAVIRARWMWVIARRIAR